MTLEIIKRESELLFNVSGKYIYLLNKGINKKQKKRFDDYISSLLINLEKNINQNAERYNKTLSKIS